MKTITFSAENFRNYKKKNKTKQNKQQQKTNTTKQNIILHVTIAFTLKQGQTRTSNRPITLPLKG